MWVEGKEQDNLPHIKFLMNQVIRNKRDKK